MTKTWSGKVLAGVVAGLVWGTCGAVAETPVPPTDEPILRVFVNSAAQDSDIATDIAVPVVPVVAYDLAMLRAMPVTSFRTSTVWTEGVSEFTGVSLKDFVNAMNISTGTLSMYAVNDYVAEVPVSDAVEGGPILAYLMDGQRMSVRDKGPLWMIYPYDTHPEYRTEVVYSRSVWQLFKIEIKP